MELTISKVLFVSVLFFSSVFTASSQHGKLILEKWAIHDEGELKGQTTYRLYLLIDSSNYRVSMIFGNKQHELRISTSEKFWNSELGKPIGYGINPVYTEADPNVRFDTWVTIHSDGLCTSCIPVMFVEAPNEAWSKLLEQGSEVVIQSEIGGAWFVLDSYKANDNKVLLGQFTTSGTLQVVLNASLLDTRTNEEKKLYDLKIHSEE